MAMSTGHLLCLFYSCDHLLLLKMFWCCIHAMKKDSYLEKLISTMKNSVIYS